MNLFKKLFEKEPVFDLQAYIQDCKNDIVPCKKCGVKGRLRGSGYGNYNVVCDKCGWWTGDDLSPTLAVAVWNAKNKKKST